MTKTDWNNITDYMDTVGTSQKTFTFPKTQNFVSVTLRGNANVTYSIGSQSGTLAPGQNISVSEKITSFTLTAVSGTQNVEIWATEDGTEKVEDNGVSLDDVVAGLEDRTTKVNKIYMDGSKNLRQVLDGITDSAINNVYEVYIPIGTYDILSYYTAPEQAASNFYGLMVPNYTTLIGEGTRENVILTMTFATANQNISTLCLAGTSGLKNLTVVGNKTRYAVHDDFVYSDTYCYRDVENCVIQGIGTYYNSAYGSGTRSGSIWNFKNCKFISDTKPAFSCHTNVNFIIPADLTFENCKFITTDNMGLKLSSLASGVTNRARFFSCHFNGLYMQEEVTGSGVGFDWNITGCGNTKGLYQVTVTNGAKYMYNFSDEVPTMIAGETIAKGKPLRRNGYYVANQSTADVMRFFGVSMSDGTLNNEIMVKTNGYVKISDTSLTTVNVGDKIGIVNSDFAVVTTGKYIGICDVSGYFRLLDTVTTI